MFPPVHTFGSPKINLQCKKPERSGAKVGHRRSCRLGGFAVLLALIAGCSKPRKDEPTAARVPADAALVATISVEKLRASTHWPRLEAALAQKLPLAEIKATCASDPVRSIQSITVAIPEDVAPERAIVIVSGVPREVADGCAKSFAATQNQMVTIGDEAGVSAYRQGEEAVFAAWLDATTVALAPGALTEKDRVARLALGPPRDAVLGEALGHLRGAHLIELAFSAPPQTSIAGFLAQSGMEPESGYGWIDLDPTLRAELVLRFATPERAASASKRVGAGPLAKVKATQRDREVTFAVQLDATETSQLLDQLTTFAK